MSRYIDAEHFDERVRLAVGLEGTNMTYDFKLGIQTTLLLLKTEPTADVVEVVHGKWIDKGEDYMIRWTCSNCGRRDTHIYDFCPDCGADMRGGRNE